MHKKLKNKLRESNFELLPDTSQTTSIKEKINQADGTSYNT